MWSTIRPGRYQQAPPLEGSRGARRSIHVCAERHTVGSTMVYLAMVAGFVLLTLLVFLLVLQLGLVPLLLILVLPVLQL